MKKILTTILVMVLFSAAFLSSCQKENFDETKLSDQQNQTVLKKGNTNLRLKCTTIGQVNFDSAKAYLDFIQLREVGTGNLVTIWNTGEWFDLLHMETGIMADIGFLVIPPATYDRAICHVTYGWAYKNGVKTYVKFPGNKMVMKFSPAVMVGEHLSEEFDIEVDINNSFKKAGNKYIFSPLVKVDNNTTAGRFVGGVLDTQGNPLIGAAITLSDGTNTYQTLSFPPIASLGDIMFLITDVPAGNYTATVSMPGYQTSTSTVTIIAGNYNSQLFFLP